MERQGAKTDRQNNPPIRAAGCHPQALSLSLSDSAGESKKYPPASISQLLELIHVAVHNIYLKVGPKDHT